MEQMRLQYALSLLYINLVLLSVNNVLYGQLKGARKSLCVEHVNS